MCEADAILPLSTLRVDPGAAKAVSRLSAVQSKHLMCPA